MSDAALQPARDDALVRALPWQWASSGLNTIFTTWTVGGSVFLLFLGELGLPKTQIGVVLSLFPFCGLLALWFAPIAQRIGRKRAFLACHGARKTVVACLLLLPLVVSRRGPAAGLAWLLAVIALFAVLRALAETAYYPWSQQVVPGRVRGMFSAVSTLVGTVAGAAALLTAGAVIAGGTETRRYLILIGAGCAIGLASMSLMAPVPGGKPGLAAADTRGTSPRCGRPCGTGTSPATSAVWASPPWARGCSCPSSRCTCGSASAWLPVRWSPSTSASCWEAPCPAWRPDGPRTDGAAGRYSCRRLR